MANELRDMPRSSLAGDLGGRLPAELRVYQTAQDKMLLLAWRKFADAFQGRINFAYWANMKHKHLQWVIYLQDFET
jgi:hypothetical protein